MAAMEPKQQPPYPLRMPGDLRAELEQLAEANGRSLNAEIVSRLQRSVSDSPAINGVSMKTLFEKLAELEALVREGRHVAPNGPAMEAWRARQGVGAPAKPTEQVVRERIEHLQNRLREVLRVLEARQADAKASQEAVAVARKANDTPALKLAKSELSACRDAVARLEDEADDLQLEIEDLRRRL